MLALTMKLVVSTREVLMWELRWASSVYYVRTTFTRKERERERRRQTDRQTDTDTAR